MKLNLFENSPDANEILIKKYLIEKSIEYGSNIKDINFDGSNISSLVSALNYVFSVLSIKTDLLFNEIGDSAELEKNIMVRMKNYNFDPRRMVQSSILLEVKQTQDSIDNLDVISYSDGETIYATNNDINFYYTFDTDTKITDTGIKLLFKEGNKIENTYFLTENNNKIIIKNYKWNIANGSLIVKDFNGDTIPQLLNNTNIDDASTLFNNDNFYMLDYSLDDSLTILVSDGILGNNIIGEISVEFYETIGTEGNELSQVDFELSDSNIEIQSLEDDNKSYGGIVNITLDSIKNLMNRIYQLQDRIVSKSDLETYIEYLLPSISYKVIDASDLPITNVIPGRTYVQLWQLNSFGDVTIIDINDYLEQKNEIEDKMRLGSVIIYEKLEYSNIEVEYTLVIDDDIVSDIYQTESKINEILMSNINNGIENISKQLLQMFIVQEAIEGMILFTINKVLIGLKIEDNFDLLYESKLIDSPEYLIKYKYTDNLGNEDFKNVIGSNLQSSTIDNITTYSTNDIIETDDTTEVVIPINTPLFSIDNSGEFNVFKMLLISKIDLGDFDLTELVSFKYYFNLNDDIYTTNYYEPNVILNIKDISSN